MRIVSSFRYEGRLHFGRPKRAHRRRNCLYFWRPKTAPVLESTIKQRSPNGTRLYMFSYYNVRALGVEHGFRLQKRRHFLVRKLETILAPMGSCFGAELEPLCVTKSGATFRIPASISRLLFDQILDIRSCFRQGSNSELLKHQASNTVSGREHEMCHRCESLVRPGGFPKGALWRRGGFEV